MPRTSLTLAAALAAAFAAAPASAQTAPESAPAAAAAHPAHARPAAPKVRPAKPPAAAAPAAQSGPAAAPQTAIHPTPRRPGIPAGAPALAAALGPDLRSSVGVQKSIFVQRFVAESLYRFDRENRRMFTGEQLRQNISLIEKGVREGADRWWSEVDRTKSGKVGRDDAQAAAIDQFRKLTGLAPDQTETKQQAGVRESFERGASQQFSRFDVNGDGVVVRAEVDRRVAEDIERIERSARIARALVEDGSRGRKDFLDLDKATVALGGVFDELDANRDGTLGAEELPASVRKAESQPLAGTRPVTAPRPIAAAPPAVKPAPAVKPPAQSPAVEASPQPPAPKRTPAPVVGAPRSDAGPVPADAARPAPARPAAKPRPQPAPKPAAPAAQRPSVDPSLFAQPLPTVRGYGATARTAQPAEAR